MVRPRHKRPPYLTPPEQFGIVEQGIYRSDMIQPAHFPFLCQLGLRTVLLLSPERPSRQAQNFIDEYKIDLIHKGLLTWKPTQQGWRPVSDELIKEGMEIVLDVRTHPIMLMCTSGIHETGTFVGCLRRLQGWSFSSILAEYHSYAESRARHMNEQFIELFDVDIVTLPANLPEWFIDQQQMLRAEEDEYYKNLKGEVKPRKMKPSLSIGS